MQPFIVLRRQRPFGRLTTPGFTSGLTPTAQWISPSVVEDTRDVAGRQIPRLGVARMDHAGATCRVRSSPSVDETVLSLAGETSASG